MNWFDDSANPSIFFPRGRLQQWLQDTWEKYDIPNFTNFAKLWPTHLLNMASVAEMRNSLLRLGCSYVPQELEDFIHHLYEARSAVADCPPAWCSPRQVDPGRGYAYRILENIERTVLLKLLDMLQSLMSIDSIVFIHDGFLISPEPPIEILQQAQEAILPALNIYDLVQPLFKCVQLTHELAQLEQTHIATPCARVPDLPNATLHSFWRTVNIKRPRPVFPTR